MPSYAMIIMIGSLERMYLEDNLWYDVSLWAEKKYIEQSKTTFANFHHILNIAKELCGPLYKRNIGKISSNAHISKKIDFTPQYVYVILNVLVLINIIIM